MRGLPIHRDASIILEQPTSFNPSSDSDADAGVRSSTWLPRPVASSSQTASELLRRIAYRLLLLLSISTVFAIVCTASVALSIYAFMWAFHESMRLEVEESASTPVYRWFCNVMFALQHGLSNVMFVTIGDVVVWVWWGKTLGKLWMYVVVCKSMLICFFLFCIAIAVDNYVTDTSFGVNLYYMLPILYAIPIAWAGYILHAVKPVVCGILGTCVLVAGAVSAYDR